MHPSKPRVDCRDQFRRRKRLVLLVWAGLAPFTLGVMILGTRFFEVGTMLLPWFLMNLALLAWWRLRLQTCPHCGGLLPGAGMFGVWLGRAPLIHDCGALLQ